MLCDFYHKEKCMKNTVLLVIKDMPIKMSKKKKKSLNTIFLPFHPAKKSHQWQQQAVSWLILADWHIHCFNFLESNLTIPRKKSFK